MKINGRKLVLSFATVLAVAMVQSCQEKADVKPSSVQSGNQSASSVLEDIKNLGFDANSIQDKGSYYLAEGDIYFSKNQMAASLSVKPKQKKKLTQRPAITVALDNAVTANNAWKSGIDQAIANWNADQNHHFSFEIVTSEQADIHIQDDKGELTEDLEIASEFAAKGVVGSTIRVNLDYSAQVADQVYTKALEGLSHSVGLRHADLLNKDVLKTQASAKIQFTPTDYMYIINGDYIFAANKTSSGQNYVISSSWAGSSQITSAGGVLYIIQFDVLYAATTTGGWWGLTAGWSGTQTLTNAFYDSHSLYAMQDDWLWGINVADGSWWTISDNGETSSPWKGTKYMCASTYLGKNGLTVIDRPLSLPLGLSSLINSFVCTNQSDLSFGTRKTFASGYLRGMQGGLATDVLFTDQCYFINKGFGIPDGMISFSQGSISYHPWTSIPVIDWTKTQAVVSDKFYSGQFSPYIYLLIDGGLYRNQVGFTTIQTISWPHVWPSSAIMTALL